MFNQYEPNVTATIALLKLLDVKVNNRTVDETLQNHPDWPSLLCIGDSLGKWNIPNGAGKIEPSLIEELPLPFLAYTHNREYPLAVVAAVTATQISYYTKDYTGPATTGREEFIKNWGGVYLIAEPDENAGEPNYLLVKRTTFLNSLVPIALLFVLLAASIGLVWQSISVASATNSVIAVGIGFQWLIMLAGVVVTALLLWYEVDRNNPVLQKVCTGIAKGNCAAILTGKQAKLLPWLSWSEVGFFYFTGGFLAFLFAGNTITGNSIFIAWLNILALPYTVFSVYYQWRIAKQWCVLCLCVQALLLLGDIVIFSNHLLGEIPFYAIAFWAKLITCYALPVLCWYALKPYLLGMQKAKNIKREYLRIKFNTEIFNTLLAKQKSIKVQTDGIGIELGNPHAENTLVKVCNPYCGPCSKAHPKIEKLLEANRNLKVNIIFSTPNEREHPSFEPVNHLMAIAGKAGTEENIKQALDDWYLEEKKDYSQFAAKYPMNGELQKQGGKIEAMYQWCEQVDIQATPTIFLNGHQLPDAYGIEDLQYFLLE